MNEEERRTKEINRVDRVVGELIQYCTKREYWESESAVDSYPPIFANFFKLVVRT